MNNIEKNKMNTGSKIVKYQNRICIIKETDTFRNRFKGTVLAKDDNELLHEIEQLAKKRVVLKIKKSKVLSK